MNICKREITKTGGTSLSVAFFLCLCYNNRKADIIFHGNYLSAKGVGLLKRFSDARRYLMVFLLAFVTGCVIFLPFVIKDGGLFLYYGDYNVQQIPFYKMAHDAVREWNIGWNWLTDLGANFIGSYTFYLLGSPFFWLTLIFPSGAVPYLMAPLLILKFSVIAVTGAAFCRRFSKTWEGAALGGLMYAFCGFNIYNIFFNHFHDAVAFFPLLLIALEEAVVNRRRGVFFFAVFVNALLSYFFFFGECIFLVIYFVIRLLSPSFRMNLRTFLSLAVETLLGFGGAMVLLLPSLYVVLQNSRLGNTLAGYDLLFYGSEQRYGLILSSLFFPPDIPSRPNFFANANAKWSSVSAYLPFFSTIGVFTFLKEKKNHWMRLLLTVCFVMAMVPALNASFSMFNANFYTRWFYMPLLIMAAVTVMALENSEADLMYGVRWTTVFIAFFSLIGILPKKENGAYKWFSLPAFPDRFWIYVGIAAASTLAAALLIRFFRQNRPALIRASTCGVLAVSVIYSILMIGMGKSHSYSNHDVVDVGLHGGEQLDLPDWEEAFYRIDVFEGMDNYPMFWNQPTIQAFHSVVPASIMEFYQSMGITRDVSSKPDVKYYGLRALESVRYMLVKTSKTTFGGLPGFEKIGVQNEHTVYENQYCLPMGFTYDHYITSEQYADCAEENRHLLLLKGIYLNKNQIARYGSAFTPLPDTDAHTLTEAQYFADCEALKATASKSFTIDNTGCTAEMESDHATLAFFSIPYEDGWSATVNGKPVPVEKVAIGFTAVPIPAGSSTVRFTYRTPGLTLGAIITLISFLLFAGYLLVCRVLRKRDPAHYAPLPGAHRAAVPTEATITARDAYIDSFKKEQ